MIGSHRPMKVLSLFSTAIFIATCLTEVLAQRKTSAGPRKYMALNGSANVVIWQASKEAGRWEYESRIEFRSTDGVMACTLDYSSEDSEHGFGVVKAEWTADSQYLVFSLTSSGGHQAWHAPKQFLSRTDRTVHSLDDYFSASGISKAEFRLTAPHTVNTEISRDESIPVSVNLAKLPPLRSWRKSKPFLLVCGEGRVFTGRALSSRAEALVEMPNAI